MQPVNYSKAYFLRFTKVILFKLQHFRHILYTIPNILHIYLNIHFEKYDVRTLMFFNFMLTTSASRTFPMLDNAND